MDAPIVNVFLGAETGVLKGNFIQIAGAVSGFPVRGVPTLQGAPTYCFAKFSIKLHEIEKKMGRGWPRRPPPLSIRSGTGSGLHFVKNRWCNLARVKPKPHWASAADWIPLEYIVTLGNRSPPPPISKRHNVFQWDPICRWCWRLVWLYPKGEAESCRMMIGLLPPRQVVEILFEQESILVGCIPPACWLWEGGGSVQGEGGCCPWGMLSRACCIEGWRVGDAHQSKINSISLHLHSIPWGK